MRGLVAISILACVASGCGAALVLHREIPRPAEIPARSFPTVYVAAADAHASREIADAIAAHLESGSSRVVRATETTLLPAASAEPGPTLALLVSVRIGEDVRTEMSTPTSRCMPGSTCYGYPERLPIEVRVQIAELVVRALDPRSGAELGRAVLHEEETDPSPIAAQLAVLDRLRAAAPLLVDVRREVVDVELDPIDDDVGREAVERARRGDVASARALLEARLASEPPDDPALRGALLFDLGQLVRIDTDPSTDGPAEEAARSAAAEARILESIQLVPSERHERALVQLRAERTAREDVRAQQAATDANFGQ